MKRPYGMHPSSFAAYIAACDLAEINPNRVMQTLGTAKASAGYHLADGTFRAQAGGSEFYCAAVDIRSHDLTPQQIEHLLDALFSHNFFAWWRHSGSFADNQHIHAVFAGLHMKVQLRDQFHDFCHDRDGLVDHGAYDGPHASEHQKTLLRLAFFANNPTNG